ncbi:monocarboxylate transporter 10-like [Latimeria chalumnae]|uniref:Major facilitator superfamily (MFS) profile domain-containing protein n=1 Tax=Latimeria chalumnae TaxID=7897 RepID=M3XGT4_LATCH|nr:PREDICTED: monocarboxylate transporter 10-like [Latimeria chalumnae]XP_014344835.1 PREDICTED: monocarboxylate transporter 10-like [Latimeria chalumnae]XP_014344837.1 PREDICTED: monocarboxylate transporter 10-like [Latimeria chalumnae]|eukprot:XP_014344834.1 PREDICTED: monocarboxylate transporter 10-like [Latimeria chalumnae]
MRDILYRFPFRHTAERLEEDEPEAATEIPAPNGGWGWMVVFSSFVFNLLVVGFHNSFGVYLVSFLEAFHHSNSETAWIGSISYGFIMIFGPISGKLLVKFGAKQLSCFGSVFIMIAVLCSSFANSLGVLFITHGVMTGIGSSFAFSPGMIMVSRYFTTKRSFATGIVMAGGAAGAIIQNQMHRYLIEAYGWRISLRIFSALMSLCIVASFAYRPLQKLGKVPSVADNFESSPLKSFIVDLELWKDRVFVLFIVANGLVKFGFFIPYVHMVKHAQDLGIPLTTAANIMLVLGTTSMTSRIIFGKICDCKRINRLYFNQVSVFCVGVLYMIVPFCKTFGSLVAFAFFLGIADAGNYILLPVLTFDLMGAERMPVAWGYMMFVNAASSFGPPFAGWMHDQTGSYNLGFVISGSCSIVSAFVLAFIPWAKRSAVQKKKSIISVSYCDVTKELKPWDLMYPENEEAVPQYIKYVSKTQSQSTDVEMDGASTSNLVLTDLEEDQQFPTSNIVQRDDTKISPSE